MDPTDLSRRSALFATAGLAASPLYAGVASATQPTAAAAFAPAGQYHRVTPYDYGADPNAEWDVNQRAAVQAMLDDCTASWNRKVKRFRKLPDLADRVWYVAEGVHVTNLRQPGLSLTNGAL